MKTNRRVGLTYCLLLSVCLAAGVLSGRAIPTGAATSSTTSSTWNWQNPLPRPCAVNWISCASAASCVAVGSMDILATHRT